MFFICFFLCWSPLFLPRILKNRAIAPRRLAKMESRASYCLTAINIIVYKNPPCIGRSVINTGGSYNRSAALAAMTPYFRFWIDSTDNVPPPRNSNFVPVLSSCTHSSDDEICRVYPKSEVVEAEGICLFQ